MMNKGIWYAIGSNVLWGLLPIYWKLLAHVPALQLVCHRIIWSYILLVVILLVLQQWKKFHTAIKQPKVLLVYFIAAILVSINWFVYIWAVNSGFIIEASLGYFICPLVSVLMGVIFLHEKLRRIQWLALSLAGIAVIYLISFYGKTTWIGLVLAISFGTYGLIKKIAPLNALYGLTLETAILFLPTLFFLFYLGDNIPYNNVTTDILLFGTGLVTTIPLLLFAGAVRYANLSLVGFLQYILPTLQFLTGRFLYHENFSHTQFIGFGIMWIALAIFIIEGLTMYYKKP